ncbi:MAG: tetratricopeptide repeat protein [Proteobacteria bacterium]|nr:tetratricopeptide repeat protein [Pseudomonadota bacterium]
MTLQKKRERRSHSCSIKPALAILAFAWGIVCCGPPVSSRHVSIQNKDNQPDKPVRLDPIHVRATGEEERLAIDAYDAAGLFERAAKYLRKGHCDEAVAMYKQLIEEFPDSNFGAPSLYNSGLCNEQLEHYQEAAGNYLSMIENYPDSRDKTDALFRLAGTYEKLEAWDNASVIFDTLLTEREDLEGIERIEALARKGSSLVHFRRWDEAQLTLDEAVGLFRTGKGISPSASTFYYAMARFKIGEIAHAEMREAKLPTDEALLEPALERKCKLLLDAQKEYTKTIRIAHPHWAAAAAYRIGNLYRNLWDDMITGPRPPDLDEEARDVYTEILKERIRVLLKKAVVQWERTLKMARRLNLNNEWIDRTTEELKEIREILALEIKAADADEE